MDSSKLEEASDTVHQVGTYKGRAVYSNGHLFRNCDSEQVTYWNDKGGTTQELIQVWKMARPNGLIYSVEQDDTCLLSDGTAELDQRLDTAEANGTAFAWKSHQGADITEADRIAPSWKGLQVLTLVKRSYDQICREAQHFQWIEPQTFEVSGPLRGRGVKRNYAAVWPDEGMCTKEDPCPLVVFLSGIGEHSPGKGKRDNMTEFKLSFRTLHKFGYLRYYDRDRDCAEQLGTVLLFPELDRDENWVKDGPDLFEYFVVPLIDAVKRPHPKRVDVNRLSIMGYSEGAFGVLHAAALYPHVFSFAVAASISVGIKWWADFPMIYSEPSPDLVQAWKLDVVMLGLGEFDNTGYQPYNLDRLLDFLDTSYVSPYTSVQVRYYAALYHKEVWDRLFNRWPLFFHIFWQGHFSESSQLALTLEMDAATAQAEAESIVGVLEVERQCIDPAEPPAEPSTEASTEATQ